MITDNVLIAQELNHYLNSRSNKVKGYLSVKVDMSKAYDRVSWQFLRKMMQVMGFDHGWVERIMACVETVTYRIKANGKVSNIIQPGRGLRQGDPISPYLFLLCQEWLSLSLLRYQNLNLIRGVKIARTAPRINHLLFADDCLIFVEADFTQLAHLKKCLNHYEFVAGQKINRNKSEVRGSNNLEGTFIRLFGDFLDMRIVEHHERYLGFPLGIFKNKCRMFEGLKDRMYNKIHDWKGLLLSKAGKEALIKSGYESVPLYVMNCLRVPDSICSKLSAEALNYWWYNNNSSKGIHWVRNEIMMRDKVSGGMGFRSFKSLNEAFLMKQLWRLLTQPDLLVTRVLKAKYYNFGDILNARIKNSDSYSWKSICGNLEIFKGGIVRSADDGGWRWKDSASGVYTVKTGYKRSFIWNLTKKAQVGESSNQEAAAWVWKRIWKVMLPDRIKILMWRVLNNAIPVLSVLKKKRITEKANCALCGYDKETCAHVFANCWYAKCVWSGLNMGSIGEGRVDDHVSWLWELLSVLNPDKIKVVMAGIWCLWRNRNLVAHGEKGWSIDGCIYSVHSLISQWSRKSLIEFGNLNGEAGANDDCGWIHCDGSWKDCDGRGGFGVVASQRGTIMGCKAGVITNCVSLLQAECKGLLEGIRMAEELCLDQAVISSDSVEALWAVNCGFIVPGVSAEEVKAAVRLMESHPNWCINHVFREENQVADSLARRARDQSWSWNNLEAIPRIIKEA